MYDIYNKYRNGVWEGEQSVRFANDTIFLLIFYHVLNESSDL